MPKHNGITLRLNATAGPASRSRRHVTNFEPPNNRSTRDDFPVTVRVGSCCKRYRCPVPPCVQQCLPLAAAVNVRRPEPYRTWNVPRRSSRDPFVEHAPHRNRDPRPSGSSSALVSLLRVSIFINKSCPRLKYADATQEYALFHPWYDNSASLPFAGFTCLILIFCFFYLRVAEFESLRKNVFFFAIFVHFQVHHSW